MFGRTRRSFAVCQPALSISNARRSLPAHALQRRGNRQQAPRHTQIVLGLGQPPEFTRRHILPDHQRPHGPLHEAMPADESRPTASDQPQESALCAPGMSGPQPSAPIFS